MGLTAGALIPSPATGAQRPSEATPSSDPAHTDVLFIGAHPDDEYQSLAAFGQWIERDGQSAGVATITRGEGGGNAAGHQEGADLGLIRETEERSALGPIGIRNVFYLDKPDFWYTLSAPLTTRVWDGPPRKPDTLERLVRLIRATTPKTVVTMDPRPFNQHGGHQLAGRLATEAFQLAGDPDAFPQHISKENYQPWRPTRLLAQNWGFKGPVGSGCATAEERDPHTGLPQQGVWEGEWSKKYGTTWAQQERNAARKYVTQGFGSLPAEITTPRDKLGCDWFSVLAENGEPVPAPVHEQQELRPLFAEFRDWTKKVGMPWLANDAQPSYPDAPTTTIPAAAQRPKVDGEASAGEYPGEELKLVHWQDKECSSADDCSATARLARHGDDLYVLVEVTDDFMGAALAQADCKRHWRTDSVEIGLDPRGDSDDTSTTFKAGILPFTSEGGACAARDADHHQGPAHETAPGMEVASLVHRPYTGYTVEAKIPLTGLPDTVHPEAMTANIMVYDSDTTDKIGKTRLAWSPFGSAQADPYVWGTARLDGYTPPGGRPPAGDPVIPLEAAKSSKSPASVDQCHRTGVPLAAGPRLGEPCVDPWQ
ncbi:sugar-binding protein [Streptomyces halobius]|uniref:PIG-L family deacetylase n=1 Tax=Streptomyces halobius TaxID=2879846 RepID=A0ABY4MHG8_9ACTN|nr:sugar-binding protein [Streptomyces halobius]UQA97254.1 PIG-L family deacetylase [Streptomyces halobius]